ncbi:divergent polysaccharide deacetylase family protein [Paragemmobacter ruber]|uniref:Divergent polysaccharide deacetylase family protein n=1 Tax=Paragemmobacter ruber TaxID=1985673 RepID=A0ABW9Y209_9RHOB|nr:divergent polysaccharide deacetylase family protein [Rhodobacter ruber]NBE05977.1 hypothetical protein [Rhodobacter ruber]
MIRGFVTGLIWGGVVATTGLAVLSQVAPLPTRDGGAGTATQDTSAAAEGVAPDGAAPEVAATEAVKPPAEPSPEVTPEVTPDAASDAAPEAAPDAAPEAAPEVADAAPEAENLQPEILQKVPDPAPEEEADLPASDDAVPPPAPVPDAVAPRADVPSEAAIAADMPEPAPQPPVPAAEATPMAPVAPEEGADLPGDMDDPVPGLAEVIPPILPDEDTAPLPPAPPEEALLQPAPEDAAPPAPALIVPDAPLPGVEEGADDLALVVPGVRTDRLPRIGDDEPAAPQGMGAAPDTAPGTAPEAVPPEVMLGTTPLELFRRDFDNPEAKPIFGLILIDEGLPAAERETLAALPFAVTFALDPLAPYAAEAARVYRAAGQEVAMVANGIPQGATPGDLEQTFQALDMAMPEAVAVLDRVEGGFQDSLDLARQAVPIVAEQGRGVVTYDRGLNSADQVARREGVPRATIFRVLDAEGESIPKMRNYLDRAAFKAAQEGRVLVIGRARAETVAAILEWTVEGRAASVALAPLSAVLETTPNP